VGLWLWWGLCWWLGCWVWGCWWVLGGVCGLVFWWLVFCCGVVCVDCGYGGGEVFCGVCGCVCGLLCCCIGVGAVGGWGW
ncbi:hypothetical protein, partial [Pseudomonas syringae group genomosp. 7]|uniref:hypothetical protein n=1 Tax=Pseudomonas syringae group genomosp. 7 TaxID=251699 RepID=UPI00376FC2AF